MQELKNYLINSVKSYSEGIELLKKYGGKSEEIHFLTNSEGDKMHFNFLVKRLQNIYRIAVQNGKFDVPKPVQIENKPIIIPRKHFSEVETEITQLEQTKLLTNKLLSRNWTELDQKEKAYFNNDSDWFEQKKGLLIDNSKIESELKSTHASLFHAQTDEERQAIGEKLVELKKQQTENWSKIDNFEAVAEPVEAKETAHYDKAALILQRNNLRARISKAQKKVNNSDDPANKEKLERLQGELKDIESKL